MKPITIAIYSILLASCASVKKVEPSPWFFYENGEVAIQESLQMAIQTKVIEPDFEKCLIRGKKETVKVDIEANILPNGDLGFLRAVSDSKNELVKTCIKDYLQSIQFKPIPNKKPVSFKQRFVFKISH